MGIFTRIDGSGARRLGKAMRKLEALTEARSTVHSGVHSELQPLSGRWAHLTGPASYTPHQVKSARRTLDAAITRLRSVGHDPRISADARIDALTAVRLLTDGGDTMGAALAPRGGGEVKARISELAAQRMLEAYDLIGRRRAYLQAGSAARDTAVARDRDVLGQLVAHRDAAVDLTQTHASALSAARAEVGVPRVALPGPPVPS